MALIVFNGNLGQDPETKFFDSGSQVTSFSVAEKSLFKDAEGNYGTEWHSCECWGKTAEVAANYLKKGSSVLIHGTTKTDTWTDDSGQKRTKMKVRVDRLILVGSKGDKGEVSSDEEGSTASSVSTKATAAKAKPAMDDIPF